MNIVIAISDINKTSTVNEDSEQLAKPSVAVDWLSFCSIERMAFNHRMGVKASKKISGYKGLNPDTPNGTIVNYLI